MDKYVYKEAWLKPWNSSWCEIRAANWYCTFWLFESRKYIALLPIHSIIWMPSMAELLSRSFVVHRTDCWQIRKDRQSVGRINANHSRAQQHCVPEYSETDCPPGEGTLSWRQEDQREPWGTNEGKTIHFLLNLRLLVCEARLVYSGISGMDSITQKWVFRSQQIDQWLRYYHNGSITTIYLNYAAGTRKI